MITNANALKAPFIWFGGKRKVAPVVWARFGNVANFAEPFAGSLATLLGRPADHLPATETVNDLDSFICNFWRANAADPDAVAHYADWPVSECDLTARHIWLVNQGRESLEKLEGDPDYYDAKVAGWWVWGINAWIGSGWCSGTGPWNVDAEGQIVNVRENGNGIGVLRSRPDLGPERGVNRQRPHLATVGTNGTERATDLRAYLRALADRLRGVRVCCGDWTRIVTNGALAYGDTVGIFLDPPYAQDIGRAMLYNHESNVSVAVHEWALANGDNPRYRIALCGYEGEYEMPKSWTLYSWSANASYKGANTVDNGNRHRERVWFSPACLTPQPELFA